FLGRVSGLASDLDDGEALLDQERHERVPEVVGTWRLESGRAGGGHELALAEGGPATRASSSKCPLPTSGRSGMEGSFTSGRTWTPTKPSKPPTCRSRTLAPTPDLRFADFCLARIAAGGRSS